jgi:hypothetical protein
MNPASGRFACASIAREGFIELIKKIVRSESRERYVVD